MDRERRRKLRLVLSADELTNSERLRDKMIVKSWIVIYKNKNTGKYTPTALFGTTLKEVAEIASSDPKTNKNWEPIRITEYDPELIVKAATTIKRTYPVKIGDLLYYIYWESAKSEWIIDDDPKQVNEIGTKYFFISTGLIDHEEPDDYYTYDEIGKRFFLTREEAEAAVAKLREEQNHGEEKHTQHPIF